MGEGLVRHSLAALTDGGDRLLKINRVPENDGGDHEVQPACAMPLVFVRSIPEFSEPVEEHSPCQGIFRLAFVEPDMNASPQFRAADVLKQEQRADSDDVNNRFRGM